MKHPLSTLSNLSYVIAGLWILLDGPNFMQDYAGIMVILLGIASGLYHWTDFRWAQEADIIMIFVAFNALFGYQLFELLGGYGIMLFAVTFGLSVAIAITSEKWHHEQIGSLAIWNLALLFLRNWQVAILATVLLIVALAIGREAESHDKHLKDYDAPHSIWHVCTAISITLMGL